MPYSSQQKGFTIIELMIALSVSSVLILIAAVVVIQIAKIYKQSAIKAQTLSVQRDLQQAITNQIQFGKKVTSGDAKDGPLASSDYQYLCVGNVLYFWKEIDKLDPSQNENLYKSNNISNCPSGDNQDISSYILSTSSEKPLPSNVKVHTLKATPAANRIYKIEMRFVYGDKDSFDSGDYDKSCLAIRLGGQFCAVVQTNSTVMRKVPGG